MSNTLVRLGFNETNGDAARACPHMAAWWPWFRLVVLLATGVDLNERVVQAAGDGKKSAATHIDGTAMDLRTRALALAVILTIVSLAREAGARATWYRDWTGNKHIHLVLDCPCASGADYQLRAADRGRDGLAGNGPDPHDPPKTIRNHTSGLAWLLNQLEEEMMPSPDQIAQAFMDSPFTANGKKAPLKAHLAELFVLNAAQSGAVSTEAKLDSATLAHLNKRFDQLEATVKKAIK